MNNSIEIYRSQDGSVQLNVKLENETVWLTQSQMAELFGRDRTAYRKRLKNNGIHIDLCSYRDLRRINPGDMKYDCFLMIAMPRIILEYEKNNSLEKK